MAQAGGRDQQQVAIFRKCRKQGSARLQGFVMPAVLLQSRSRRTSCSIGVDEDVRGRIHRDHSKIGGRCRPPIFQSSNKPLRNSAPTFRPITRGRSGTSDLMNWAEEVKVLAWLLPRFWPNSCAIPFVEGHADRGIEGGVGGLQIAQEGRVGNDHALAGGIGRRLVEHVAGIADADHHKGIVIVHRPVIARMHIALELRREGRRGARRAERIDEGRQVVPPLGMIWVMHCPKVGEVGNVAHQARRARLRVFVVGAGAGQRQAVRRAAP